MTEGQPLSPEEQGRMDALLQNPRGKELAVVVQVPAAKNMFSNGVFIGTLKMGAGSASVDVLRDTLLASKEPAVAVVGTSDALTVATIEAAIQQLEGKPTTTTILFAGDADYLEQLQKVTSKAGVPFEGVVYSDKADADKAEPVSDQAQ
ncbi:MAG: hypothetical protein LBU45_05775 [Azoarcus sp.]|nr:hypothetical protein [Azoarcus sp.]